MADVSQIKLPNGSVYDLIDEKSGYITADYIENKTDYEIPVSRVGEIVVGETAIGTESTNFPTSKAVVDYVDERVVQEIDAIDVGVISVNGKTGSVTLSASDVGAASQSYVNTAINNVYNDIPTSTSQLTNNSGFITASDVVDEKVLTYDDAANNTYALILTSNSNFASTQHRDWYSLYYYRTIADQKARLYVGGLSYLGILSLGNTNGTATQLMGSSTANRTITLPDATGTVALTSDIPSVPSWALQSTKPTYTASEVGALPSTTAIPSKTSDLTNDSGFITIDSDEKLKTILINNSEIYYPIFGNATTQAETKYYDSKFQYTAGSGLFSQLILGSTSATGYLTLRNSKGGSATLGADPNSTSLKDIRLPDANGTIALISDIPTVPTNISSFTNDSGYLTASDIASVMTYKGIKANYAALPASGNTTGDVWHLTDTGAEWAWDGSAWQELGTAIDLSGYATKATTLAGYGITDANIQNGTITLGSNSITPLTSFTETDPTVPSWAKASTKPSYGLTEISGTDDLRAIEALTGTSGLLKKTAANTWTLDTNTYLTSYTETDPIFSASAASEITSADISNWNGKSDTDEKLKTTTLTSGVMYLIGGDDSSTASTKYINNGLSYQLVNGRTSMLIIGTDGYSGALRLAGSTSNTRVHIQHNATANRTITLPDKDGTVALTSDIPDTSSFLTSETDPVFSASAAAGITATDISNWNAKVSDDKTWNGVTLSTSTTSSASNYYIPSLSSTSGTTAYLYTVTNSPTNNAIAKYDSSAYLKSTTPSANDNSTKVATTAYVDTAIPKVYSSTNTGGYLTIATLPIYDGTVV